MAERASESRQDLLGRLAYAQGWSAPQLPELMAFAAWVERYRGAATSADRAALESEGVALARARRPVMLRMIQRDPQRALAATVPAAVRQVLPASVLAELESRVAGKGEFMLRAAVYEPGESGPAERRIALINGVTYTAYPYGRREAQLAKDGASLHGIALDRQLALHESPLRVLEPGEIPPGAAEANCPVSNESVAPLAPVTGVNLTTVTVVEAQGRIWEFCDGESMLPKFEGMLLAAEEGDGSQVRPFNAPGIGREPSSAQTVGVKPLLVIRVDFSDLPGEPITTATALAMMNNNVSPFFDAMSYGKTALATTVSDKVYRLPQTANSYAVNDNDVQMHTDARTLAGADYNLATFERILVIFANIGPSRFPTSKVTYGGAASVNGANIWINGSGAFTLPTVAHELGHTYGLKHANLWKVSDGNPLSAAGTTVEYGDPFDDLGASSVTGVTRDTRHHFNPWFKNRLGWIPDSAVTTVGTSGVYRIYRFDAKDAPTTQPLALRIFRDGVRSYWVGLRQSFATGTPVVNDAYVVWGFNNRQQSQLLDLTTPGTNANDAALAIGSSLVDPAYGITITPLARGGAEPAQWLDVQVTIANERPNVVMAWGREGGYFFDDNDAPTVPAPETNVPMGLVNVQALAVGEMHALALKGDGSLIAWGDNTYGQITVPAGLGAGSVMSIAAGKGVSGAVRTDGTVRVWGDPTSPIVTGQPAGLSGVRKLALGFDQALALKADGTVVAWGGNANGQSTVPAGLANATAVVAGDRQSIVLHVDGTVSRLGTNNFSVQMPAGLSGVKALSCNGGHVLALKNDGTVVAWGNNGNGQSIVPAGLSGVIAVAAGGFHSLALKADGTVVAWGSSANGQTVLPPALRGSYAIAASSRANFALTGPALAITEAPQSYTIEAGTNKTLTATAFGSGALTYQWNLNGVPIAGATGSSYAISSAQAANAGQYTVTVSDPFRSVTSSAGTLTVSASPLALDSRLYAISCRAVVGTGGDVLIPGIAIGGTGSRQVVVRAKGPSIQGVAGVLARPKLELHNANTGLKMAENIGWSSGTTANTLALQAAFAETNLPPFALGSADSALVATLDAGSAYTAVVSGVNSTTGISVVEVYELGTSNARMIAISCRARVGTGDDVLIPGIIVSGSQPRQVIIRASGPALTAQGVPGALSQLQLKLFSGGTMIGENTGWSTAPNLNGLSVATVAAGLTPFPPGSADCAMVVTLPPGGYTAHVSGLFNSTGVALIEVYEVP